MHDNKMYRKQIDIEKTKKNRDLKRKYEHKKLTGHQYTKYEKSQYCIQHILRFANYPRA